MHFAQTSQLISALAADFVVLANDPLVISMFASLLVVWVTYVTFMRHLSVEPNKLLVVITGCDSGFGLGTAERLTALGYKVVATCMTQEGLTNLQKFTTGAIICDVTKDADVKALADLVDSILDKPEHRQQDVRLWTLINNAGIAPFGCVDWMPMDSFKLCIEVNYYGPIRLIHQFLPLLKQTPHSRIVNLSSVAGLCGAPFMGPYGGSKHALEGMGKCLREELMPFDVHVCHINPGVMK